MNSLSYILLSAAILIQLTAAVYALYLIRITGRRLGWILISAASLIMVIRRVLSLIALHRFGSFALFDELSGLCISIIMLLGTVLIKKYFLSIIKIQQELSHSKQELQKSEAELEKINRSKDRLFSIIAHDLKNPFNTLLNFSDLILKNYEQLSEAKKLDFLNRIKRSARQGYALLENLLHWSQFQTGTITIHPKEFDVKSKVDEAILILEEAAKAKNIQIVNELQKTYSVFADQQMLTTVIRNLLSNAVKFTNRDGKISISAQEYNEQVEICVSDNGRGMSREDQDKLFGLDTNFSTAGTENEKGSGLGLILCREFVEKNGGSIWVESELGKGSKFGFNIPTKKKEK